MGLKERDLALTIIHYASLVGTDLTAGFALPAPADCGGPAIEAWTRSEFSNRKSVSPLF
jgi:hypothetical protein